MIAGHLPFTADTAAALMRQHVQEPPSLSGTGAGPAARADSALCIRCWPRPPPIAQTCLDIADRPDEIRPGIRQAAGGDARCRGPTSPPAAGPRSERSSRAQSSQAPLDPLRQTMGGTGGTADAFLIDARRSRSSIASKSRSSDSGVAAAVPGISHNSLDAAKPCRRRAARSRRPRAGPRSPPGRPGARRCWPPSPPRPPCCSVPGRTSLTGRDCRRPTADPAARARRTAGKGGLPAAAGSESLPRRSSRRRSLGAGFLRRRDRAARGAGPAQGQRLQPLPPSAEPGREESQSPSRSRPGKQRRRRLAI